MTGASIKVDDRDVKKALRELRRKTKDTLPVMRAIGHAVRDHVDRNFLGQHGPDGKRWDKLSDTTKDRRRGTSYHILRDTGRLANSITSRATKTQAIVGTDVIYAGTQQFGARKGQYGKSTFTQKVKSHSRKSRKGKAHTVKAHSRTMTLPIPWGNIPARPFLPVDGLPKELRDDIMDLLEKHLEV